MLGTWLSRLLNGAPAAQVVVQPPVAFNPDPDYSSTLEDVPRYPPFDHGLPFVSVDDVLKSQQTLVSKLSDGDLPFAAATVRNLAAYVHLLPATTNDFFCGAGGLLRLCLETGYHSYVASQGNIFTAKDPAEKRRELEPKWQLASFLAGLCCELGRAISTSVVTNDHGQQWLPFEPLTTWLARTQSSRYFLRPPQATSSLGDSSHFSSSIWNAIIPNDALQHITTDDRSILMAMLETIANLNQAYGTGQFSKTVRKVRDQVIARDKRTNPLTFGKPSVGVHVEPYLISAMRALVKNGTWKINQKLARVHLAPDGAFVFWSTGVEEILTFLKEQGALGMPTDPRSLGELLMNSGVLSPNRDGGLWWYVRPPTSASSYEVVRLANPAIILDDDTLAKVSFYAGNIVVESSPNSEQNSQATQAQPQAQPEDQQAEAVEAAVAPLTPTHAQVASALAIAAQDAVQGGEGPETQRVAAEPAPHRTPTELTPRAETPAGGERRKSERERQPASAKAGAESRATKREASSVPADPLATSFQRPSVITQLRKLRDLHNEGGSGGIFWTDDGLAMSVETVRPTGDHLELIGELHSAGAIYVPEGETRKIHRLLKDGAEVRAIIIPTQRAIALGFKAAAQ